MEILATAVKRTACLLALTLFAPSLQSCKSEAAKGKPNGTHAMQNQTSPRSDSQQPSETAVPAPSTFREIFVGRISDKYDISMSLERNGADLTGSYAYERAGAYNEYESENKALKLKGLIDGDGNVTLTETSDETGNPQKTGEFKGKLDGLSGNDPVRLRFSGLWTGGKEGKQMPFSLLELRFDLGGFSLDSTKERISGDLVPHLAGADTALVEKFNRAVTNLVARRTGEFKKLAAERAREAAAAKEDVSPPSSLLIDYVVAAANKDFISILFSFSQETGGNVPNNYSESLNYDLNRNAPVSLADLFNRNSNYLKVISDYSIGELEKLEKDIYTRRVRSESQTDSAEELEKLEAGIEFSINMGAGPELKNFRSWNITPTGLRINFDTYQVGPYVDGPYGVVLPYSMLKPIIKPDGLLAQFVR
ncbi:MAG TPA: RsiV family protein [Blastocatellia bacterium]